MKLLFLHIGKTGGTSIRSVLDGWFGNRYPVATADNTPTIKHAHKHFNAEHANRCDLVYGHYDWSIAAQLPGHKVLTVLREPVDRLVSQYAQYCRKVPVMNGWNAPVMAVMDEIDSFDDFVRHPAVIRKYLNYQARILSGQMWGIHYSDPFINLRKIRYLGLFDDLEGVMARLADDLGVRLSLPHANRIRDKATVSEDTRAYILREHAWDVELVESAREIIRQSDRNVVL